jgi:hypothetical protein
MKYIYMRVYKFGEFSFLTFGDWKTSKITSFAKFQFRLIYVNMDFVLYFLIAVHFTLEQLFCIPLQIKICLVKGVGLGFSSSLHF